MVIDEIARAGQQTKDNIGPRDTTADQILFRNREQIFVEEGPTIFQRRFIDTSFILGHTNNGILGTSTLGSGGAGSYATFAIVNANKIWHEHFRDNFFFDSTNSTGSTWDTTNFRLEMVTSADARTGNIFDNNEEIASVKVTINKRGLSTSFLVDLNAFPGGREVNLS